LATSAYCRLGARPVRRQPAPGFADYETKTDREIPVVVLEPV